MVGEARRAATALAGSLGFGETGRGRVAIVATEAATNLSKHATGGEILIQGIEAGEFGGVEILALDRGPGMADVDRCMSDGYSTAGSPGTGLGAMSRLSGTFDVHSLPELGTAALSRLWAGASPGASSFAGLEFGAVSVPLAGEEVCGDCWAIDGDEGRALVLVVDGLGHGPQAAEAARKAVGSFAEAAARLEPAEVLKAAHAALGGTRGAALAVARIDRERGEVRFAGVGNISGVIYGSVDEAGRTSMVSHNGTVGHTVRKIQEFVYPWTPGSTLIMHSDGVATQWRLDRYAGLSAKHPGLIAGTLHRDFRRPRDDATVVVARDCGPGRP
ncbi:ATP-binding SpoIIE family protein phosphatase [Paludisphaera soli]|uniref:ATP-binding SpoIIE family protein phosphatase n=1 Tax=Paludisphaera soli TaxID=2712865 RepID=UPI0013ED0F6C